MRWLKASCLVWMLALPGLFAQAEEDSGTAFHNEVKKIDEMRDKEFLGHLNWYDQGYDVGYNSGYKMAADEKKDGYDYNPERSLASEPMQVAISEIFHEFNTRFDLTGAEQEQFRNGFFAGNLDGWKEAYGLIPTTNRKTVPD